MLATSAFSGGSLKVQPGQAAPRFFLVRLDNDAKRAGLRDYADSARRAADSTWGKPVVLAFWTTTCVNCRAEMPRLQKWAETRDIVFLPMLVENTEPAAGMAWLDGIGVKARGLHDRYQVAGQNYGVCDGRMCTVPALVAISPDGKVRLAKSGYVPTEPMEDDLDKALALGAFKGLSAPKALVQPATTGKPAAGAKLQVAPPLAPAKVAAPAKDTKPVVKSVPSAVKPAVPATTTVPATPAVKPVAATAPVAPAAKSAPATTSVPSAPK